MSTYEQKKRQICRTSLFMLFACLAAIAIVPTADASIGEFPQIMCDTINDGVINTITGIFNSENDFFKTMTGTSSVALVSKISKLLKGVCGFIIACIAMVHLFQELNRGKDGLEAILKMLMELFITMFIMMKLDTFLGYIVQIGTDLITDVTDLVSNSSVQGVTLEDITGKSSGGFLWWLQSFVVLFIPYALSLLISIVAKFVAYSILIEIGIRRAFAPIPVCFIYGEGLRSPGARYLLRFMAVFIKIAICLAVCGLQKELINAALGEASPSGMSMGDCLNYLFTVVAINFTGLGVMMKGGEIANEIVGA